jgi:endonuclease III
MAEMKSLVPGREHQPPAIDNATIGTVLAKVRKEVKQYELPIVTFIAKTQGDPFKVLISTMLSLRTKDLVTAAASERLFAKADKPQKLAKLPLGDIQQLIYPVGFYKTKAAAVQKTSQLLLEKFKGKVPDDIDALTTLPGVGRKTANLVLTLGFGKHGICVDTHVHRISNIWGYVKTRSPHETEMALRAKLPRKNWIEYNDLLVSFGQHICVPVSPRCSQCPIFSYCPRIGVQRSR